MQSPRVVVFSLAAFGLRWPPILRKGVKNRNRHSTFRGTAFRQDVCLMTSWRRHYAWNADFRFIFFSTSSTAACICCFQLHQRLAYWLELDTLNNHIPNHYSKLKTDIFVSFNCACSNRRCKRSKFCQQIRNPVVLQLISVQHGGIESLYFAQQWKVIHLLVFILKPVPSLIGLWIAAVQNGIANLSAKKCLTASNLFHSIIISCW